MSLTNSSPTDAAIAARSASHQLATLPASARDAALNTIHAALAAARDDILAANARDLQLARDGNLGKALIGRLDLATKGKFEDMLQSILSIRDLEDPVGKVDLRTLLDDGLTLERISCPIGVLLIIFEARPEIIANIASLAIKSGNAVILKGGKESTESFKAISSVISSALSSTQVPNEAIQLVITRDVISDLLALDRYIDLVIPRGSNDLVRHVQNNTRIPVLGHADGLCTIYLAADADATTAPAVLVDAKTGYPSACNAVETLLVHRSALGQTDGAFAGVVKSLRSKGVTLRCDGDSKAAALQVLSGSSEGIEDLQEKDLHTEFLDLILAVKTVDGLEEAITHINEHGSHHTESILTASEADAERFMAAVDSAGAYWNASTRLADGMRYGFGTEVGISTSKIHARGPVGLQGLMIYKYKVRGRGQVASTYGEGEDKKKFLHKKLL